MTHNKARTLLVASAVIVLGIGGGIAVADIPSSTDGTVTACMVKPGGTIRLIDAEAGATCKKGEQKVEWNAEGQPGSDGADGVSGYEEVSANVERTVETNNTVRGFGAQVDCPAGKRVVGGGGTGTVVVGNVGAAALDLTSSTPFNTSDQSSWSVNVSKRDGSFFSTDETAFIRVYAICVTALP